MFSRPIRCIVFAGVFCLAAGIAQGPLTLTGPNPNAQVNVPYSSAFVASGGVSPYFYTITLGALPTGLNLNSNSGAVTGTPQAAGTFTFTGRVSDRNDDDPIAPSVGPDSQAAARRRRLAQGGTHSANTSSSFTITVAAAPSPTPVPPSVWMAMTGLAGAGLFRLRQTRRG